MPYGSKNWINRYTSLYMFCVANTCSFNMCTHIVTMYMYMYTYIALVCIYMSYTSRSCIVITNCFPTEDVDGAEEKTETNAVRLFLPLPSRTPYMYMYM